jgi:mono/diheme cytochrome c family protein
MDFPIFHLEWLGNRMLVGIVAVLHVLINHPLAVGAYPLIALIEWQGMRRQARAWDDVARRIAFVSFLVTTTVGAVTGVGIWVVTSLVAPFAIGSLLRVFFWSWFTEWFVFIIEIALVMAYYLTWTRLAAPTQKRWHLSIGVALAAFSWLTMAIIVAILGFMMSPGDWTTSRGLVDAILNPLYAPQLAFRTTFSMFSGGLYVWACIALFRRVDNDVRAAIVRLAAAWTLAWLALCVAAALWYWSSLPAAMQANAAVALLTQAYSEWGASFLRILAITVTVVAVTATVGLVAPLRLPRAALLVAFVLATWWLGHFERAREFLRKPYVIADYMYANGVRVAELPLLKRDGVLAHATWTTVRIIDSAAPEEAGREVFMLTCSRCHTTRGMNGVRSKLQAMYGDAPWDQDTLTAFVTGMHLTRTFMPPFPGSDAEAAALAAYLRTLQPSH